MEKTQREYYLNEQLKAIQKELGEIDEGKDELSSLSKAISEAKMPKLAKDKCLSELKKLKSMSPMSAEATVVRNYLDWMTELPWSTKSKINTDLKSENRGFTKKELLKMSIQRDKLQRSLGGISDMKKVPDLVFIIDTNYSLIQDARDAVPCGVRAVFLLSIY